MSLRDQPIFIEPDAWCAWCGESLPEPEERHHGRVYCSKRCKWAFAADRKREATIAARPMRNCVWCGTAFRAFPSHKLTCSRACNIALFNWRRMQRNGWRPARHPWAVTHGGADPDDLAGFKRNLR